MMIGSFHDPFEGLFAIQRALDAYRASDWLGGRTAGTGSFPPINVFQQGHDFVAIIELPGIDKKDLDIQAKENTIRISGKKAITYPEGASGPITLVGGVASEWRRAARAQRTANCG